MEKQRQPVTKEQLLDLLLTDTSATLGRDASFLARQIEFRRREGEPNWDANCGVAGPAIVKAFSIALAAAQERYKVGGP